MSGEWVACSDRLPEDARDLVPVATDGVAGGVMSHYDGGWCFQSGMAAVIPPTHWFDVPDPPSPPDPDEALKARLGIWLDCMRRRYDGDLKDILAIVNTFRPRLDAYGIPDTLEQVGWTWVYVGEATGDRTRCFGEKRPEAHAYFVDRRVVYAKRLPDEGEGR